MSDIYETLEKSLLELITQTSTNLPSDVRTALKAAREAEFAGTRSNTALDMITENIAQAEETVLPICQDTGMPTFKIKVPIGFNQIKMKERIHNAISAATKQGKLRTNSVDSLTGENTGDNLGPGTPVIYFEQWENDSQIEIKLILKGGGCENKNIQYSLPCTLEGLGRAGRDLDGVRKCIMHSIYQAQGQGCSAGFIGVAIGGDRTSGSAHAKEQLFRRLDDTNPHTDLAKLEDYVMANANKLGIGTMGFGGETTLLGCKVGLLNRLPASYYVSVAYNCWAYRRLGVIINADSGEIESWLYRDREQTSLENLQAKESSTNTLDVREVELTTPIAEEQIRELKVGDIVYLSGSIYTGRDAVHKRLHETGEAPVDLQNQVIYHCGPVMLKDNDGNWQVKGAGPTTSIREEPYQADILKKFGIRAVIGKGGMGAKTLAGLKKSGAVYLNAIGGAAQYYSRCIKAVRDVNWLELGIPEAVWELEVERFPAIVTMDSHGESLHAEIDKSSLEILAEFAEPVFK